MLEGHFGPQILLHNRILVRSVTTGTVLVITTVFVNTCTIGALVHLTSCL